MKTSTLYTLRWILCLAAMFSPLLLAQPQAADVRLPPIVVGKWCYLGTEGLLKVPGHPDAQLYEDCRDGGGGGCEDISFVPGGMEDPTEPDVDCKPRYPVTKTTQTIYGLDAIFTDRKTGKTAFHLLLNMIAPRRMLITFYPGEEKTAADNTAILTQEKQQCFATDPNDKSFNVRAKPNKQSKILITLENGFKVSFFKRQDNWAFIQTVDDTMVCTGMDGFMRIF
jgi:hypothetical protein